MVTINGVRYITQKKYGELTGISQSRISQLKSTLPIEYIEGLNMELINYDLIQLKDDIRKSLDREIASKEILVKYSLPELGDFFQTLIYRLLTESENAFHLRILSEQELQTAKDELEIANTRIRELELRTQDLDVQLENRNAMASDEQVLSSVLYTELEANLTAQKDNVQLLEGDLKALRFAMRFMEKMYSPEPKPKSTDDTDFDRTYNEENDILPVLKEKNTNPIKANKRKDIPTPKVIKKPIN